MSQILKVSGKKLQIPDRPSAQWKFTQRPGGWVVAESETGLRKRFMLHEHQGRLSMNLDGYLWHGELSSKSKGAGMGAQGAGSDSDLVAQFPGKVRKVLAQKEGLVAEGDPLLLIEAMKMEFAVKAPYAGKVIQVLVQEGQQLSPGDRLVDIEVSPPCLQ